MITLYSTHCPKCQVLEQKLKQKNIEFDVVDDTDKVVEYGIEHNIKSAPILDIDGESLDFTKALKFIAEYQG